MRIFELASEHGNWMPYLRESTLFRIGVEYEVESIQRYNSEVVQENNIKITNDGSLRNQGQEFITSPETKMVSLLVFKRLFDSLTLGEEPFSSRTSIHVHMNVASMEIPNFYTLLYAYAALEPIFFNYVGSERLHNIHCVPLSDTYLSKYYTIKSNGVPQLVKFWSKYTAFNIRPSLAQGSVEFRHMYGTNKYEQFQKWVNMIEKLYIYSLNHPVEDLKTFWSNGGTGKELEQAVFGEISSVTEKDMRVSVMESKSAFL